MENKRFGNKILVRIDKGEEIVSNLEKVCIENNIKLWSIQWIWATNKVTIWLFATKNKKYYSKEFTGDFEIAPLVWNISTMNGKTYLHLHINIGDDKQNSYSGHLNSAIVSATFEWIIDIIDWEIDRKFNEEIGLNLIIF